MASRSPYSTDAAVQSFSGVQFFVTPQTAACQSSLSLAISQSLLKLMSIESMMPSNHLILCCPLLLLPQVFPSIWMFSNELTVCIRWPEYWSFSFSIHPFGRSRLTGWISLPELKSLKTLMKLTCEGQKYITEGCSHSVCVCVCVSACRRTHSQEMKPQ